MVHRANKSRAGFVAAPSPEKLNLLTQDFDNEVAAGGLPGAVIPIQQHGRPVYLKCFGCDIETKTPMTPDTNFALHSMTNPITSLAALMLVDAGKIALDDPVSKYIPAFADMKVGAEADQCAGRGHTGACPGQAANDHHGPAPAYVGLSYAYIGTEWVMRIYSQAHLFDGPVDDARLAERVKWKSRQEGFVLQDIGPLRGRRLD